MTLQQLNDASVEAVTTEFLTCCGSTRWVRAMVNGRPFDGLDELLAQAEHIWWSLDEQDWLEAFRSHPKIGERKAAAGQSEQAQRWSAQEQSSVSSASMETVAELAEKNRKYEERFGFIFIVCASGKSPQEMLAILNSRLANDRGVELRNAAEEQRKITRLRLEKLLNE